MLKIKFILLFGVLLGGMLSVAVIKGRGHSSRLSSEVQDSRHPSQQ